MRKLGAVLFDFDGTLYDSFDRLQFVPVAQRLGWKLPLDADKTIKSPENFGKTAEQLMQIIWPGIDQAKMDQFHRMWEVVDKETLSLFPGTHQVFSFLESFGVLTGIITQRRQASFLEILKHNDLFKFLDPSLLQGSDAWIYQKPDPQVFNQLIVNLMDLGFDVSRQKIVYVGDSKSDVLCVQGHKIIEFVGVESGPLKKKDFINLGVNPKNVIRKIYHILEWIKRKKYLESC